MPPLTFMLKPASGRCNMACSYCFYRDETRSRAEPDRGLMTAQTLENTVRRALEAAEGACSFIFQGGEPTLAGLDFFRRLPELERRWNTRQTAVSHSIQTNGLLLTDAWARFLAANRFLVGLSLDGPEAVHDACRRDRGGGGTFRRVLSAAELLRRRNVPFNVLSVVTDASAGRAAELYGFFRENGFLWQQYIPCLEPLFSPREEAPGLSPGRYGTFLKELFDLWYGDFVRGRYVYNRYFENLTAMLAGRQPESCDRTGRCSVQYLVEADGSVYPCDFYAVDAYRLGNINTDSVAELDAARARLRFLETSAALPEACRDCRWLKLCRGGCRRDRDRGDGSLGRDRMCEAYRTFFPYAYARLHELSLLVPPEG